ncbi:DUF4396 domain-containing protein [Pantoea sp.]|uniref:DUF4396 domain-containing protein n=1 Tax=Pantoea sp. TaxID=69393 RepID=UPI002911EB8B|nr:DUF4396 domain-containing protein [Pantoea sp.]MDU4125936.1 DUF4396 domain-containing protein [Pantoea sp.]
MLNQWALLFLVSGVCTALMITKDIFLYRQPGRLMNLIWPLTGLYLPFIGWLAWWYLGRIPRHPLKAALLISPKSSRYRGWQALFIATAISAAACILAEALTLPIITLLNYLKIPLLIWQQAAISLLLSFLLLLLFQFFSLPQHEKKSFWQRLSLAFKRSAFPLLICQAGIFFFMALALKFVLHQQINPSRTLFWFMLQLAMMTGFVFSWPANHFIIKRGINPVL